MAFAKIEGITDFERVLVLTGTLDMDAVKPDSEPEGAGKIGEPSEDFGMVPSDHGSQPQAEGVRRGNKPQADSGPRFRVTSQR